MYERGLELQIQADNEIDAVLAIAGQQLEDRWGDWFIAHQDQVKIPK